MEIGDSVRQFIIYVVGVLERGREEQKKFKEIFIKFILDLI